MHRHTSTVIDRAIAQNRHIIDADVTASQTLREVAEDYIRNYTGTNQFVQDVAVRLADFGRLSAAQMRGALNVMIAEAKHARNRAAAAAPAAPAYGTTSAGGTFIDLRSNGERQIDAAYGDGTAATAHTARPALVMQPTDAAITPLIPNGYYTVILDDTGAYRTLRVADVDTDRFTGMPAGTQILSVLSGEDNTNAYTAFAFLKRDQVQMWKRFNTADMLRTAADLLVKGFERAAAEYVLRSSRCFVCGRPLTTPTSIAAGIGPICRENVGGAFDFDFDLLARAAAQAQAERTPATPRTANFERSQREINELFPE